MYARCQYLIDIAIQTWLRLGSGEGLAYLNFNDSIQRRTSCFKCSFRVLTHEVSFLGHSALKHSAIRQYWALATEKDKTCNGLGDSDHSMRLNKQLLISFMNVRIRVGWTAKSRASLANAAMVKTLKKPTYGPIAVTHMISAITLQKDSVSAYVDRLFQ